MKKALFLILIAGASAARAAGEETSFYWEDLTLNLPDAPLRSFAADPHDPQRLYVATARAVWGTRDGGKTWERTPAEVSGRKWIAAATVPGRAARAIEPFLSRGDGESLFAPGRFEEELRRRVIAESEFSGPTFMEVHPANPLILYAGSFDGFLVSRDGGKSWEPKKTGAGGEEGVVLHLAAGRHDAQKVFAGTMGGLFVSPDGGKSWKKQAGLPVGLAVSFTLEDPGNPKRIWVGAAEGGIYCTEDGGRRWENEPVGLGENPVRCLAVTGEADSRKLFAATGNGLYCREEPDRSWRPCGKDGALGRPVNWVAVTAEGMILAAGERGLFRSADGGRTFRQESVGLRFAGARQALAADGKMLFLAPLGLFRSRDRGVAAPPAPPGEKPPDRSGESPLWQQFRHEPTVQETQRSAMRFAETHPEKIRAWRRGVKWRALLPRFELGFAEDRSREKNLASKKAAARSFSREESLEIEVEDDQDTITTAGFNGTRQIPTHRESAAQSGSTAFDISEATAFDQERTRDRNTDFEMGAVWDLGNLLYNPEEVDISKEARELAELRDNLLKEVTQYYFRRRHLQIEILAAKTEGQNLPASPPAPPDPPLELRRELELQELTAHLDALTGGWFSGELENRRRHFINP